MATATIRPVSGSFTGSGQVSDWFQTAGGFNLSLSGFGTATVKLQRSFDEGDTAVDVETFTASAERRVDDPEPGVWYRFNCSSHSSGTISYRLSGGARK